MRCFVSVADTLNWTRAAEALGVTQPAMSVQMRELERETGLGLLDRSGGRIRLTPAGQIVRDGFVDILSLYDSVVTRARDAQRGAKPRGTVRVGYHGATTIATPLFREFRRLNPGIGVGMRVAEWLQLTNMVISGELDAAVVERHETEVHPELRTIPLFTETFFCVAISTSNPLSQEAAISVGQLMGQHVIMSGYRSASMDSMYRQLLANGLRREQIELVDDVDSQIAMAASDMGMAARPRFLAQRGNADVRWVPVVGVDFSCEMVATWRSDNASPCLRLFLDFLSEPGVIDRLRSTWIQMPETVERQRASVRDGAP